MGDRYRDIDENIMSDSPSHCRCDCYRLSLFGPRERAEITEKFPTWHRSAVDSRVTYHSRRRMQESVQDSYIYISCYIPFSLFYILSRLSCIFVHTPYPRKRGNIEPTRRISTPRHLRNEPLPPHTHDRHTAHRCFLEKKWCHRFGGGYAEAMGVVSICAHDEVQLGRSAQLIESVYSRGIGHSGYREAVLSGTVDA